MMDWPSAFVIAVMCVSVFGFMGWQQWLRAEVMKEAIRHGATSFSFDDEAGSE